MLNNIKEVGTGGLSFLTHAHNNNYMHPPLITHTRSDVRYHFDLCTAVSGEQVQMSDNIWHMYSGIRRTNAHVS